MIDLSVSDEKLALSLKQKTNNIKNKELNYILRDRNIFSYMSSSTSSLTTIPNLIKKPLQLRDLKGSTVNTGKENLESSILSGINFKLGGRLEKTAIIPRKSSQTLLIGNMSRGSTSFKNSSRLTYKNKRGAYSITVTSSYLSPNK
jgi:hypothetical protein